jgi:hypothetical protein
LYGAREPWLEANNEVCPSRTPLLTFLDLGSQNTKCTQRFVSN